MMVKAPNGHALNALTSTTKPSSTARCVRHQRLMWTVLHLEQPQMAQKESTVPVADKTEIRNTPARPLLPGSVEKPAEYYAEEQKVPDPPVQYQLGEKIEIHYQGIGGGWYPGTFKGRLNLRDNDPKFGVKYDRQQDQDVVYAVKADAIRGLDGSPGNQQNRYPFKIGQNIEICDTKDGKWYPGTFEGRLSLTLAGRGTVPEFGVKYDDQRGVVYGVTRHEIRKLNGLIDSKVPSTCNVQRPSQKQTVLPTPPPNPYEPGYTGKFGPNAVPKLKTSESQNSPGAKPRPASRDRKTSNKRAGQDISVQQATRNRVLGGRKKLSFLNEIGDNRTKENTSVSKAKGPSAPKTSGRHENTPLKRKPRSFLDEIRGHDRKRMKKVKTNAPKPKKPTLDDSNAFLINGLRRRHKLLKGKRSGEDESADLPDHRNPRLGILMTDK